MSGIVIKQDRSVLAPIALFVYNRPWHTRQTVQALQRNGLAGHSDLFIFSDYAKSSEDLPAVHEVREYIQTIGGFNSVTIIEREQNWGLAKSIIDGVTCLCAEFGRVIVLEDDLVTSPYFLQFMNDGLNCYEDEEQVMHISGYMYPVDSAALADTFFIAPASCWGWATWQRAWQKFEKNTEALLAVFDKKMIRSFNLGGAYDYFSQVVANKQGKINTWGVYWYASVFLAGGLSLHPKLSFVSNIGHDGSGVNCNDSSEFNTEIATDYNVEFATQITKSEKATKALKDYFESLKVPVWRRIGKKVSSRLMKIRLIKRYSSLPNWHNLRSTKPISAVFGFDRGMPIDRFFIEHFLQKNRLYIKGTVLEIAEPAYSKKFALPGSQLEVLHYENNSPLATIVGDLTKSETLPSEKVDCFICTQTLNFIYDCKAAISGMHHLLKKDGVALVTVAGISQISRYDMERWGDYWRFTTLSIKKLFDEVFGEGNVTVDFYGNVLTSISFLEGIAAEELTERELLEKDQDYQMTITVLAKKC